ncbi:hypothetical protein MPER_02494, partial [Moniliophthora perniciosa FA553]
MLRHGAVSPHMTSCVLILQIVLAKDAAPKGSNVFFPIMSDVGNSWTEFINRTPDGASYASASIHPNIHLESHYPIPNTPIVLVYLQIPLPPSPTTQSIREDEPTSRPGTAQQPPDTTEKIEEKTEEKGPTLQESWKILTTEVGKYDEGMVKSWKEDIDTLLVFGGLFSAVVSAFLIESYQWLSEDPADITVMLPYPDFHAT